MSDLIAALSAQGLDALWVSAPANVHYLSHFSSPEDAKVLVQPGGSRLYTDARYAVQAAQESPLPHFIARPPLTWQHAAEELRGKRVGFEASHLTVQELHDLQEHWAAELVPTRGMVEALRLRKTPEELEHIRTAQRLTDEALAAVQPLIQPGTVERDLAFAIETELRRRGAVGWPHGFIVASGPRSAMPHGAASERVMGTGELVTIDIGAVVGGYHSDMTRSYGLGEVPDELRRIHNAVLDAEERAVRAVAPGVRAADLDALARDHLAQHGLAEYFVHSLGHGVGLGIHEGPSLRATTENVLAPGMVITIEPGVYVPGLGGARFEDLVLVTETGYEVLSTSPKVRL